MLFVDIEKCIGNFTLKVCFETEDDVLSLLGPSGSGKSMTLKCIAGIEKPDKGKIILNDRVLFDSEKGINLPPQKRKVGYLFQQYALFPNMTVKQNIEVALHYLPKNERAEAINVKLEEFHLKELEDKKPQELSGGEQQRVALARIIANNPEVLLLDEPFSALDSNLRWQLLDDMKKTLSEFNKDVVFVTHNIEEVIALSNDICNLNNGKSEPAMKVDDVIKEQKPVEIQTVSGKKAIIELKLLNFEE